jgi:hypothetical protein
MINFISSDEEEWKGYLYLREVMYSSLDGKPP